MCLKRKLPSPPAKKKKMNFRIDNDNCFDKAVVIFENIENKLNISFEYSNESKGEDYFKTNVTDQTFFKNNERIVAPNEGVKYTCRILLKT